MDTEPAAPQFPPNFLAFLKENHIDVDVYNVQKELPRYVRILRFSQKSATEINELVQQIRTDAGCDVSEVDGVPGFLRIANQDIKLSQLRAYAAGSIIGMDVSSGIAALSLSVEPGDNVLDLCCAPGAKLLLIAELLSITAGVSHGTVTGVDISPHRISTCRSLIKKHAGSNKGFVRLYAQDGTQFSCMAPRTNWWDPAAIRDAQLEQPERKGRRRAALDKPWFAPKLLSTKYACSGSELYDRVLVDAECTHDGSLAHVQKYERWGWEHLDTQVVNNSRSQQVPVLQSKLLENGWQMLKPGGVLVYSTCSLSRFQNEYVLGGFLARHAENEAQLEVIPLLQNQVAASPVWQPSAEEWVGLEKYREVFARMKHAVRLDPRVSNTSGMFIARIKKLCDVQTTFDVEDIVPLKLET
ncbi:hypothetical protein GGH12_005442 [Coemansia sp. RSA 1822]|nr:hypothetical protein LPJ76_005571 [Coemansia sp. RSA 638]KAJ2125035.1 hypothetical protein IW147_001165 [Coemansia sp. RSA 720]KAJ2543432.1 hypothetical protein GGF49_002037 [Coemansia sp. RSA 1853]KAJ2559330.1 hypothetical protein GGH12_005442 [Coemansia sp. RSA 1822]